MQHNRRSGTKPGRATPSLNSRTARRDASAFGEVNFMGLKTKLPMDLREQLTPARLRNESTDDNG